MGDGRWVELWRWATMEAATTAAEQVFQSPACAASFGFMAPASELMLHAHPVGPVVRP